MALLEDLGRKWTLVYNRGSDGADQLRNWYQVTFTRPSWCGSGRSSPTALRFLAARGRSARSPEHMADLRRRRQVQEGV